MGQESDGFEWLLDAEVKSQVKKVNGRWEVSLIFIDTHNPLQFLIRKIGDYRSENLANIAANYMQKTAARDARGTQKTDRDAYNINDN